MRWPNSPFIGGAGSCRACLPATQPGRWQRKPSPGAASAVLGLLQYAVGAAAGAAVGLLHNGTAVPMAGAVAACEACVWLVVLNSERSDLYALVPAGKALSTGFSLNPLPKVGMAYATLAFPADGDAKGR